MMKAYRQARNPLETPRVAKSFLRAVQIFQIMFNSFQQGPADFSRGAKNFARVCRPPALPVAYGTAYRFGEY